MARKKMIIIKIQAKCMAVRLTNKQMDADLLHPDPIEEAKQHKLKKLIQTPNSYFLDIKCPSCGKVVVAFSHAQTVIKCNE